MRRVLYVFLPNWPIDRNRGSGPAPFARIAASGGRLALAAVNPAAAAAGLAPGMPLADALSFVPGLATAPAAPAEDAAALRRLAEWCRRYSPWTAPDGIDGIKLEITGCAHLWGGEAALAADLAARLGRRGLGHRLAIAGTLGAAWALARFADRTPALAAPGTERAALAPLPVEALRLDPATAAGLRRVGLARIGEVAAMPRDALARRFGAAVARRLDQAEGAAPEPLSPLGETPARRVRLSFAEPLADPADLARAAARLAGELARGLARDGAGARRVELGFHRVDGRVETIRLGLARASRDPAHLAELLAARLDTVDPGDGVEDAILAAFAVEKLDPEQIALDPAAPGEDCALAPLIDRLAGEVTVGRFAAQASHIPERASAPAPPGRRPAPVAQPDKPPRPVRLFRPPQPIEAFWLLPDEPPFRFAWRRRQHRVAAADGPERIAEEWWRPGAAGSAAAIRDYYRVEDEEGRRFWLFRAGLPGAAPAPRWYLHGVFA